GRPVERRRPRSPCPDSSSSWYSLFDASLSRTGKPRHGGRGMDFDGGLTRRANPVPLSLRHRAHRRRRLCRHVRARHLRRAAGARDHGDHPQFPPRQMTMRDDRLIALYLDMLAAERGASANTLAAYGRDLEDYTAFLAGAGTDLTGADAATVRAYLQDVHARGFKASSAARRLSAVRQLHKFLYAEGCRGDDPTGAVEEPKQGRPLPKVLSVAEVDRPIATAHEGVDDEKRPLRERRRAARLACLLELIYATGLRVSELVSLPVAAARTTERFLLVKGKGGKERLVPLTEAARRAMRTWLDLAATGEAAARPSPWLFPADSESGHLTRQAFARELKDL